MSIAEYRAAKDRLIEFDAFVEKMKRPDAKAVWKTLPTMTITLKDDPHYPHSERQIDPNGSINHTLSLVMDAVFLGMIVAKTRERLVASCARHKISAANEARGIIAEDAPK